MTIFCVGRNYEEHINELLNIKPKVPIIFMKNGNAVLKDNKSFYYPQFSKDIHYEVEFVLRLGKKGKHIQPQFAENYISHITIGIDFTARDIQTNCKNNGLPWEIAKAFDHSAVIGELIPFNKNIKDHDFKFSLLQNNKTVQTGHTKDMIFNCTEILVYLSQFFTLNVGDYIFTGTPSGVGKINIGDVLQGFLGEQKMFECPIK